MKKLKLGIMGCGKLGEIVARACADGLLEEYVLVGTFSRTLAHAQRLAQCVDGCTAYETLDELVAQKLDYIVEAASPQALRELLPKAIAAGTSIAVLSIGAFADADLYATTAAAAREKGVRIHLASGAIGGFDVLRTAALMSEVSARMITEKGPDSLRGTPVFSDQIVSEKAEVFCGTATEAIALLPTRVNVAVAASLASAGTERMRVSINSTPGFVGDDHRIEVEGDEVRAVVDIYSKTSAIAGWSVVALLQNLVSPIVF